MIVLAAYVPTPKALATAACVRGAIAALGWSDKEWGIRMGLAHPQQVNRQLSGREPMNIFRLAELPDEFQAEYDARKAALRGARVLEAQDLSFIRGAVTLGEKRMARFIEPASPAERQRA